MYQLEHPYVPEYALFHAACWRRLALLDRDLHGVHHDAEVLDQLAGDDLELAVDAKIENGVTFNLNSLYIFKIKIYLNILLDMSLIVTLRHVLVWLLVMYLLVLKTKYSIIRRKMRKL